MVSIIKNGIANISIVLNFLLLSIFEMPCSLILSEWNARYIMLNIASIDGNLTKANEAKINPEIRIGIFFDFLIPLIKRYNDKMTINASKVCSFAKVETDRNNGAA